MSKSIGPQPLYKSPSSSIHARLSVIRFETPRDGQLPGPPLRQLLTVIDLGLPNCYFHLGTIDWTRVIYGFRQTYWSKSKKNNIRFYILVYLNATYHWDLPFRAFQCRSRICFATTTGVVIKFDNKNLLCREKSVVGLKWSTERRHGR